MAARRRLAAAKFGDQRIESACQYGTYRLTAQEIKEEVRRIKDLLDVDVQNQFNWMACL